MAFNDDAAKTTVDSWGIKRLFSHVLRRWLAGTALPRVPFLGISRHVSTMIRGFPVELARQNK